MTIYTYINFCKDDLNPNTTSSWQIEYKNDIVLYLCNINRLLRTTANKDINLT